MYISISLSIYLSIYICIYVYIYLSIYCSIYEYYVYIGLTPNPYDAQLTRIECEGGIRSGPDI